MKLAYPILGFCLCFAPFSVQAAPVEQEKEFVNRVNKAIEKGKKFLIEREGGKGNWEGILLEALGEQTGGQTALATLALLNCVPAEVAA